MKKVLLFIFVLLSAQAFSQQCTPSLSIIVSDYNECAKNDFILAAVPINGGSNPTFQWERNGVVSIYSGPYYPARGNALVNGDILKCTMTSSDACANPKTVSASHTISYYRAILPTTITVSPSGPIYAGTTVSFLGKVTSPDPFNTPLYYYRFFINGKQSLLSGSYGDNTPFFQTNTLKDGDVVFCTTTVHVIGNPCADVDTSNSITMSVTTVLPLTLSQFNLKSLGDKFLLNWTTATETNTDNFNIQVSRDGNSFVDVGKVKAAGNSSTLQSYNYTYQPTSFSNETFYFRLKTDDKDGRYTMSPIKSSSLFGDFQVSISPNPAKDIVNIKGTAIKQVQLFDLSGKLLLDRTMSSNNNSIDVSNISRGIYLLRITNANDKIQVQKIVLQ